VRTFVDAIEDAVAIAIVLVAFGAAVLVVDAVFVFGDVRALVVLIEDAVLIVVRIGTAVFVFEVVEVFRIARTAVDVVANAIAIAIVEGARFGVLFDRPALRGPRIGVGVIRDIALRRRSAGGTDEHDRETFHALIVTCWSRDCRADRHRAAARGG